MKMKCTEGTTFGDHLDMQIDYPSQEEADNGDTPVVFIDSFDLLGDTLPEDSAGIFEVPIMSLLLESAERDGPEIVLNWLQYWISEIKKIPKTELAERSKADTC